MQALTEGADWALARTSRLLAPAIQASLADAFRCMIFGSGSHIHACAMEMDCNL